MKIYELIAELCYLGFDENNAISVVEHYLKPFEWELEDEVTTKQAKQILDYAIQLFKLVPISFLKDSKDLPLFLKQLIK